MRYHDLGMFNLLYLVSGPYPDGKRVIWTNGSQCVTKFDYDTFDSDASFDEKWAAAQRSGMPPTDGAHTLLDANNHYTVAGIGFVRAFG